MADEEKKSGGQIRHVAKMNGLAADGPLIRGSNRRVKIDVGGQIFETTTLTLQSAGKSSLLARSAPSLPSDSAEIFFDRDPQLFQVLLGVLRTGKVSIPERVEKDAVIEEAVYYGMLEPLKRAMAPSALEGIDMDRVAMVLPNGRDCPSSLCAAADGSIWVGHGSKITAYDWALRKLTTTLTELHTVEFMHRISDAVVAVGAEDFPGLHMYDAVRGAHVKSLIWSDKNDTRIYKPCVRAISSSNTSVFASFENGQRMENTVLVVDKESLQIVKEIGRQSGNSGHSKVPNILQFVPSQNLLMVGGVHGGAFGYSGYIRMWDVRSDRIVWEWTEPNANADPRVMERDSFADIVANEELGGIFKVSVISGNLAMADFRSLKSQEPWMPLVETNPALCVNGGSGDSKLLSAGKQIFCSRGGDLEVWSEVPLAAAMVDLPVKEYWETSFRRNFIEHSRRHGGHEISSLAYGGNRLFVSRREMQGVEVWESNRLSSDVAL